MWSDYSEWSSCSGRCGEKIIQRRIRRCLSNQGCEGENHEEKNCIAVDKCKG